jgi:hypothetical protein
MADFWSKEEGAIFDAGSYIIPCTADTTIALGAAIGATTTATDGAFEITDAAGVGDGFGIACRAAAADGDVIPVLFYGIYKCMTSGAGYGVIKMGSYVMNSTASYVTWAGTVATTSMCAFGGSSHILGLALQTCATLGDEICILVGKCI